MVPVGIRFYGLGAITLGVVGIAWGDFALQWQPVAAWFPARTLLAYLFAAALVVAGACVNDTRGRRATVFGATALAALYTGVVILMHGPLIIQHPASFANWSGGAEQATLVAGGLASYAWLTRNPGPGNAAVTLMGVCLVIFGMAHFLYLDFTASMVPAWLPGGQKFWAVATGIGHIAAGVAFLTGVRARLAAVCITAMFGSFSILVHLPLILTGPRTHLNWVMNAINLALTGAAWAVATYLADAIPVTGVELSPGEE
ncbi:MAG: hypothetical protein JSR66_16350 [Proteobacteria bacterium]|nr:hypothetical protein [Pseudomonadota bacterium]